MMLVEHDAKVLLAALGLPVPPGHLASAPGTAELPGAPPWLVKAQVPAGGRGKAGGVVACADRAAVDAALLRLVGATIKGHPVLDCRIEQGIRGRECYLSIALDAARGRLHVLASPAGGVDIEAHAAQGGLHRRETPFTPQAVVEAVHDITAAFDPLLRHALREAAAVLARAFFELEATLVEINPLFVREDGSWVAGDAKLALDENALVRQPRTRQLVEERARVYPEVALKLAHGFDFVVLDPQGEVGLVTTGAGLSMQLIDEIAARGHCAYNFCDIRTGQFRGDPARLVQVLRWIAAGPAVRTVLINFFAGVTHLGELARVLLAALAAVPELKAPVTLRLIGNGYDEAVDILRAAGSGLAVEPDLERAIDQCLKPLAARGRTHALVAQEAPQ